MSRRHTEILRAWKSYLERAGATAVYEEPYLLPVRPGAVVRQSTTVTSDARADLVARGLFQHGRDNYYDIACLDTATACFQGKDALNVLENYEKTASTRTGLHRMGRSRP